MAIFSERSKEGYLQIDHRASPGVTSTAAPNPDVPIVGGGVNFEAVTRRCSQCHQIIVFDIQRTRFVRKCLSCMEYHCDRCVAAQPPGHCETLDAVFDRVQRETEVLLKGTD